MQPSTCDHDDRWALRRFVRLAVGLAVLGHAVPAAAQGQDEAGARTLFNEGRQLEKTGRYEEACAKFEAAKKLYSSSGLLLNLADCEERLNRTASAWAEFGDAAFVAASSGRSADEAEALRRQAALEPKLSRIVVRVAAPFAGESVRRDGVLVDRGAWDTRIPVDPGVHAITAEGPGHVAWSTSIEIKAPGTTATVEVPPLADVPPSPAPAAAPAHPPAWASTSTPSPVDKAPANGAAQRIAGLAVGGAGLAAIGVSGALGLVANAQYHSAEGESGAARHNDSTQAAQLADAATVVVVAGGAAMAAGLVLWLTAPRSHVAIGSNGRSILLTGTFE